MVISLATTTTATTHCNGNTKKCAVENVYCLRDKHWKLFFCLSKAHNEFSVVYSCVW